MGSHCLNLICLLSSKRFAYKNGGVEIHLNLSFSYTDFDPYLHVVYLEAYFFQV